MRRWPNPASFLPTPFPNSVAFPEDGEALALFQINWPNYQGATANSAHSRLSAQAAQPTPDRLCVRHRGKAFLLDDKTPVLTIGRDLGCKLIIDDRKASRQHARVERRNDGFYLVDTSTNGCFVTLSGRQEVMVRRHEIQLESRGQISFGNSGNDPLRRNCRVRTPVKKIGHPQMADYSPYGCVDYLAAASAAHFFIKLFLAAPASFFSLAVVAQAAFSGAAPASLGALLHETVFRGTSQLFLGGLRSTIIGGKGVVAANATINKPINFFIGCPLYKV